MGKSTPVETALNLGAALWMAGCSGFAAILAGSGLGVSARSLVAVALSALVGVGTYRIMSALPAGDLRLADFTLEAIAAEGFDVPVQPQAELLLTADMVAFKSELLLTRGQMLHPPAAETADELLLSDVLSALKPDSRVVQLFQREPIPTAGELKSRIDSHLSSAGRLAREEPRIDDSQALFDALADLRRSLG